MARKVFYGYGSIDSGAIIDRAPSKIRRPRIPRAGEKKRETIDSSEGQPEFPRLRERDRASEIRPSGGEKERGWSRIRQQ
jgi:hypothetical protein